MRASKPLIDWNQCDSICDKIKKKENIWSESVNSCPKLPRLKMIIQIQKIYITPWNLKMYLKFNPSINLKIWKNNPIDINTIRILIYQVEYYK